MALVPRQSFEYQHLDYRTKTIVWQRTSEIKELMRLTAENIISIGQKLTEVKEKLGHGSFQNWLRSEFEWSEQTARQFMQVYRWSKTIKNKNFVFSQLATSALYLLAAPSTPPEARDEVLSLIDGGEKISYSCVKTIVDRCKKPLLSESEEETIDIQIEPELAATEPLFRLKTSESGHIVRLYRADEIKKITDLTVGATVKIEVGRWSGRTAIIAEVLNEQQLDNSDRTELVRKNSTFVAKKHNFAIYPLEEIDSSDSELQERHLVIKYGDVRLAIAGDRTLLTAFTTQIQTNIDFVAEILARALNQQKQTQSLLSVPKNITRDRS